MSANDLETVLDELGETMRPAPDNAGHWWTAIHPSVMAGTGATGWPSALLVTATAAKAATKASRASALPARADRKPPSAIRCAMPARIVILVATAVGPFPSYWLKGSPQRWSCAVGNASTMRPDVA